MTLKVLMSPGVFPKTSSIRHHLIFFSRFDQGQECREEEQRVKCHSLHTLSRRPAISVIYDCDIDLSHLSGVECLVVVLTIILSLTFTLSF